MFQLEYTTSFLKNLFSVNEVQSRPEIDRHMVEFSQKPRNLKLKLMMLIIFCYSY